MGADALLDFVGLEAQVAAVETPTVDSSAVETPEVETTEVETPVVSSEESAAEAVEGADKTSTGTDGSPVVAAAKDDLPGTEKTPKEIREALKALKAANPANSAAVKQLHRAYEHSEAYKSQFPTVDAAREAKSFIDAIGGYEGYEQQQNIIKNVEESDALLYAGDGKLIDNIYDDMKSEGKEASFAKLAIPFLDKLKATDNKAFADVLAPHYMEHLELNGFPDAVAALAEALEAGDENGVAQAKKVVAGMANWFKRAKDGVVKSQQGPTPEQLALKSDREKFEKEQQDFKTNQTKEFQTGVAKDAEKTNTNLLSKELGPFIRSAYFKGFGRENLRPLAATIQNNLYNELQANKAYQTQMKALWGQKTPDRAKILEYHKTTVEAIAGRIVRDTVTKMYPDHAKGGSAAGRVAAAAQKKEAVQKVESAAAATGKPVYVAVKPSRDQIDYEKDPKSLLEIAGKAYLKNGKFVTWRKPMN
jgi:hypothetical protein